MLERTRPTTRGTGASNAPQEEAKMNKCNEKCEVYSRVTGYFRPVANWNKGKKEEFADRKMFKVQGFNGSKVQETRTVELGPITASPAKPAVFAVMLLACVLFAGCSTARKLAEGVSEKAISGSGTVAIQRVGIDDETKTPVLKSTVITGDYASARNGDYAFQYRRRKSPSIFNKDAVTEEVTINYIGTKEQALAALEIARKDVEAAAPAEK